ncbi:MAG: hypothetical protein HGA47_15730 [Zoogloea sp.]|nr:hypothetical protein [Zoogloea sp.]
MQKTIVAPYADPAVSAAGHALAYVFLDFDGVTHPWGEVEDFRCLPVFEDVVREFPEARIVIASDWRTLFSMKRLVARFSPDIQPRVVGSTPQIFPHRPAELHGLREREARQWLASRAAPDAPWCAVDDAPGNWPTRDRLVLTDYKRGFTEEDAGRLSRLLNGFRQAQA